MSAVAMTKVSKAFANQPVLWQVSLEVAQGEFLAILGPSGCGKTTLLRCLAGFELIDHGQITVGQRLVAGPKTQLPAHRRQVVIVPQDGSLFPHLSVGANVGFGLANLDAAARRRRIGECLELVGLPDSQHRPPQELSGGMRQRVAVARALAPRPPLILLDEPFSALDAGLRAGLRADVRAALAADGATGILVTHDQSEALSMADRVAVMGAGQIRHIGTPQQVYDRPVDEWVAGFLGEANILAVDAAGQTVLGVLPGRKLGSSVIVRPEWIELTDPGPAVATGEVTEVEYYGHDALVRVRLAEETVIVRVWTTKELPTVGQQVGVRPTR